MKFKETICREVAGVDMENMKKALEIPSLNFDNNKTEKYFRCASFSQYLFNNDILDSIDDLLFQKEEFVRKGLERGFCAESIDEFWEMLKRWENLAMKSVYVSDCMLEYRLAYLKANYFEFFDEN